MNSKRVLSEGNSMNEHSSMSDYKDARTNNLLPGVRKIPDQGRVNLWSPCSDCSSDDNNSPTALNTFNWDKPALEDKSVDFGWSRGQDENNGRTFNSKTSHTRQKEAEEKLSGYTNVHSENSRTSIQCRNLATKSLPKTEHKLSESCGSLIGSSTKESIYPTKDLKDSENKFQQITDTVNEIIESDRTEELIIKEKEDLRNVAWFQAGIPREIALEVLSEKPEGSFIVRESTTKKGCYALSLRVPPGKNPDGIAHYLILPTNKGYKIKGFTKEFSSLNALIIHHSVMPEMLPCPLSLSRHTTRDAEHEFEETEQKTCDIFSDIHWIMTDLEV